MTKDLVAAYARIGLIIAAFALVTGIIASPILPRFGSPAVVAAKQPFEPTFDRAITPASLQTGQTDKPN
jgi:hypothetical protein